VQEAAELLRDSKAATCSPYLIESYRGRPYGSAFGKLFARLFAQHG